MNRGNRTNFSIESEELTCECGHTCIGITELLKHGVEHEVESLKNEYRKAFGVLWDMTSNEDIRRYGLCGDSGLQIDFFRNWNEFSNSTKDKLILDANWGYTFTDILKKKIIKIKKESGVMNPTGYNIPLSVLDESSIRCA